MTGPLILASVGTFHLRFDRFVQWVETVAAQHHGAQVELQHGVSRPMPGAHNRTMMPPSDLLELLRTADVVILQGGAGGIMDARTARRIPIVIARTAALGEMVDDHQVTFMTRLDQLGHIHLATSVEHLAALVSGVLDGSVPSRLQEVGMTEGAQGLVSLMAQEVPVLPTRHILARSVWAVRQLARGAQPLRPH